MTWKLGKNENLDFFLKPCWGLMYKDSYTDMHLKRIVETYLEVPINQEYFFVKV